MKIPENVGQWLVLAGGVIHGAGAKMIQARNDELAAQLDQAHAETDTLINRAYLLGRHHNDTGQPSPDAEELAEMVRAAAAENHRSSDAVTSPLVDVDAVRREVERRAAAADVDEHQGTGPDPSSGWALTQEGATEFNSFTAPNIVPRADVDEHQGDELAADGTL